jgi:hypothetical protein
MERHLEVGYLTPSQMHLERSGVINRQARVLQSKFDSA